MYRQHISNAVLHLEDQTYRLNNMDIALPAMEPEDWQRDHDELLIAWIAWLDPGQVIPTRHPVTRRSLRGRITLEWDGHPLAIEHCAVDTLAECRIGSRIEGVGELLNVKYISG